MSGPTAILAAVTKRDRRNKSIAKRQRERELANARKQRPPMFPRVAIASFDTRTPEGRLAVEAPKSHHATNPDFLYRNLEFGYLVRELSILRKHNLTFAEGDPQETMFMFAEGALVLVAMERFLRTILGKEVAPGQTLPNLLELAFGERLALLDPPGGDRAKVTRVVVDLRNALLHANFEQAAKQSGARDVRDYFRNHYAREIEFLYRVLDRMVAQIDPGTGLRRETPQRRNDARARFVRVLDARRRRLGSKSSRPG